MKKSLPESSIFAQKSKNFRPRCWNAEFRGLGGDLGLDFAGLGKVLGSSGAAFEDSWASLWRVCGDVGPSWNHLGGFGTQQASETGRSWAPRRNQHGTQNGAKSKTKTQTKKEVLEGLRLGAILGRSWVVLGIVVASFWAS